MGLQLVVWTRLFRRGADSGLRAARSARRRGMRNALRWQAAPQNQTPTATLIGLAQAAHGRCEKEESSPMNEILI